MVNNPDCSACVHAANIINAKTVVKIGEVRPFYSNRIVCIEDIILGGGSLLATNSVIYRSEFANNRLDFFNISPVEDRPLFIHLGLNGQVYYMDDIMSVYRIGVAGSWTNRVYENMERRMQYEHQSYEMLDSVNEYTDHKYSIIIDKTKRKIQFNSLIAQGKIRDAKSKKYIEFYRQINFKNKINLYLMYYFPKLYIVLRKIIKQEDKQ